MVAENTLNLEIGLGKYNFTHPFTIVRDSLAHGSHQNVHFVCNMVHRKGETLSKKKERTVWE